MPPEVAAATTRKRRAPGWLFLLELTYLGLLLLVCFLYFEVDWLRDVLPVTLGPLPAAIPWFGAVGAVLAGLGGQFFHEEDWDDSFNHWHISRPLLGAIEGPIGCLLLLVTVRAASTNAPPADAAFYDAAAFLIGFADKTFRDLITKATQVIIGPGNTNSGTGGAAADKPKH